MVGENAEAVDAGVGGGSSGNKMSTLEEYGTNSTKLAKERIQYSKSKSDCIAKADGTYDKKKKQEGKEPGVGKTAIADGLAQRIANGNVPETIEEKKIRSYMNDLKRNRADHLDGTHRIPEHILEGALEHISEFQKCRQMFEGREAVTFATTDTTTHLKPMWMWQEGEAGVLWCGNCWSLYRNRALPSVYIPDWFQQDIIFQNEKGETVAAKAKSVWGCASNFIGECMAILEGVKFSVGQGLDISLVESDCSSVQLLKLLKDLPSMLQKVLS
ncbi:Clp R domain-containing protein [Forsythia ovata]|uniref:Clp R domain-containing protein n=1 Tax=Forsythia ovata TaxID=205694 RepID=A0ABD1SL95_9LAMI